MQALRAQDGGKGWGAGALLKEYEDRLFEAAHREAAAPHARSVAAAAAVRDARAAGLDRL